MTFDNQILRRLVSLESQVKGMRRSSHLGHSSFVGSIDEKDADGNLVSRTGLQHDGTHGAALLGGPVPAMPTTPLVSVNPGLLTVTWNGRLTDGTNEIVQPLDFEGVEIFYSVDDEPTFVDLAGAIMSPAGGSKTFAVDAGVYQVAVRSRTVPGRTSALTEVVTVTVPAPMNASNVAEQVGDAIEEAMTTVGTDMALLNDRLDDAFDGIEDAVTTANGKNKVFRRVIPAPPTDDPEGKVAGDMWWQFADADYDLVVATWMWSGAEWVSSQLGHAILASVNVATLTVVGAATLAQAVIDFLWTNVVRANKITTEMLLVGRGENLVPDPLFTESDAWTQPTYVQATGGKYGGGSLLTPSSSLQRIAYMGDQPEYTVPVREGERYRLSARFTSTVSLTSGRVAIYARYRTVAGSWQAGSIVVLSAGTLPANTEHSLTEVITVPTGVTHLSVGLAKQSGQNVSVRFIDVAVHSMTDASLVVDGGILARHIDVIDLTAATAFVERVRALGIILTNAEGEVMLNLTGLSDQVLTIPDASGNTIISLDNTGRGGFKALSAQESILYRGQELATYWSSTPEGLLAIGGMGAIGGGRLYIAANREMGLFDVPVPVLDDRWYRVTISLSTYPSTVSPEIEVILRASSITQNVVVTPAASPLVASRRAGNFHATAWDTKTVTLWFSTGNFPSFLTPGTTARLLLSVYVNGNTYIDQNTTMTVEAIGRRLPFTQTINQGGATTPPPGGGTAPPAPTPPPSSSRVTRTDVWSATDTRNFRNGGASAGGAERGVMQGRTPYYPSDGIWVSQVYFNSPAIRATLSGATVEAVSVRVKNLHWHLAGGGTAYLARHNNDGPGPASAGSMTAIAFQAMGRGEERWIEISPQFGNELRDGVARGFGFLPPGGGAAADYSYFDPSRFQIAIRYTK